LIAAKLTPASDVYSLAVIAYELLTGRRPNNPESGYQLREMQEAGVRIKPTDLRPGLPLEAEAIILKGLSFKAESRPQRARDFGDFLAAALTEDDEHTVLASAAIPLPSPQDVIEPEAPAPVQSSVPEQTVTAPPPSKLRRWGIIAAIAIATGLLSVALAYLLLIPRGIGGENPAASAAATAPEQSFTYSLTVQKMRGESPDGGEIEMSGAEIYGNGWKFRFNVLPAQKGAFYLLNEAPAAARGTEFNALFPTPQNGGSAAVEANQRLQTRWYVFDKQTGIEKLWIIWSDKPVAELDEVFDAAAKQQGVLNSAQAATVQSYLARYDEKSLEVKPDKAREQTVVKGKGELFVQLLELAHKSY
jgi:hypothetical protein